MGGHVREARIGALVCPFGVDYNLCSDPEASFAVATYNAGATASVDVTGTEDVPVSLSVCAGPADCFAGNQSLDGVAMPAAGTASFFVLVTANDYIDVRPGLNRVYVRFRTPDGVTRGSTSAAVASF
jgi:hypothetical protein